MDMMLDNNVLIKYNIHSGNWHNLRALAQTVAGHALVSLIIKQHGMCIAEYKTLRTQSTSFQSFALIEDDNCGILGSRWGRSRNDAIG